MHYGRIVALVGVVIGAVGLLIKKASSDGEVALAQLSQAPDSAFPPDLAENTWTALYNDTAWAAVVLALAAVVTIIVALAPPFDEPMKRLFGLIATVMGVIMLLIGVFATLGAMDDADTLEAGFAQAAAAGVLPVAFAVSIGFGWYLLVLGGAIVAIGGVLSLMARPDEDAIA
ncbi:MAG: hypothetical protein ACC654_02595 [Acidimicrobiia bacterium]